MLSTRENYSCEKSSMSGIQPTTSNFDSSINKQSSSSRTFNMLEEEITEGNCLIVDKMDVVDEKINTTPKKRFFDLKRSAESATNKIKSPSRFLLNNLTPKLRRKSAANHKLSQLEQHGNLFIRERGSEEEERTNNNPETLMSDVSMENGAAVANTKNQQTTIISNSSGMSKLNKISLIPSFISPNRNKMKQQQPTEFPNYEEIDIETIAVTETFLNEENFNEMMSKTDLMSSNVQEMLKNIPVRQRKSAVPHMENYCLFDPAVDFYNEKELRKNNFATADFCFPKFSNLPRVVQYDVTEHDDRIALFHNYYEIDPELLEKDENNRIVGNEEYIRESTSSSSSCDYPSTDDNANADNLISCNATGAKRKYLPQMERIVRKEMTCNSANNSPRKSNNFDPLKASHSLPQLETVECNNSQQLPIAFETHKSARKTRPLSSDSGFTTPSPPNECQMKNLNSVREASNEVSAPTAVDNKNESTVLNQCDNIQQLIEIYTEWANYYLEKHKSKRKVVDLSADARDGLLLAEIIEAVTSFKVPDLIKKPKNQQQMVSKIFYLCVLWIFTSTDLQSIKEDFYRCQINVNSFDRNLI
ncbi:hypothetical protein PVAND_012507 [Polypedilum vanderplanki]|uniref:Calponin-homology (CH) domain-containing protein n=1 Tax=Polypedilum vanderplanki TaxID=319348 RepID=A0A9J6CNL3_POLVA|nr:hypothetical protein PVAND_012507 [Polypedilum vanderplanki]